MTTEQIEAIINDDATIELSRTNWRTGAEYSVWCQVTDFEAPEAATFDSPGSEGYIDAEAIGSLGQRIELTQDELDALWQHRMNPDY